MAIDAPLSIAGIGVLSALGPDLESHVQAIRNHRPCFLPLGELLGPDSPHARRPGAWIKDRGALTHRKWSPATMAALHVARQAIREAEWTPADLKHAALVIGTSRGNAAGWLGPWPGRRPFRLMAASNTIHSEPATAIAIEFQITGPNHVLASGCAAGLDAIGVAMMMVRCGLAPRALAVAVDLPLVPMLLDNYAASGILSSSFTPDPYRNGTDGFIPAEGAAAVAIEPGSSSGPRLSHYGCNSDASDPIGIPSDGGRTPELFEVLEQKPLSVCPHATGTAVQKAADPAALVRSFQGAGMPALHLLKPFLGHAIGASGLLETAVLAGFMRGNLLPPNMPGLFVPEGFSMPDQAVPAVGSIAKLSHGMGGHNALLVMEPADVARSCGDRTT